jgi:hypothetical protein
MTGIENPASSLLATGLRTGSGGFCQDRLDDARRKLRRAEARCNRIRQAQNFQSAGAVRQATDETALFQSRDQPMNPDFEARSKASFISSKEGGIPDSFNLSWMNRSSSCCLRVSMSLAQEKNQIENKPGTNTIRSSCVLQLFKF